VQSTTVIPLPSGAARLVVSAQSAVGAVRAVNEDSFLAATPLFVVADGMGGHERGDRASQTVVAVLQEQIPAGTLPTPAMVLTAITDANVAVRSLTGDNGQRLVSGTTLAGLALVESQEGSVHWMAFNVGDSRIYSWNGRLLEQLSVDHSAVQELIDAGQLTELAARSHPERNVITRAVGAEELVDADVWLLPIGGAQSFILCSDGLTKELDDTAIARLLAEYGSDAAAIPAATIADALVEAANRAGGKDNITVVVLDSSVEGAQLDDDNTNERTLMAAHLEETRPRA
jgi:serine/threonine protein phosphatase PrpC